MYANAGWKRGVDIRAVLLGCLLAAVVGFVPAHAQAVEAEDFSATRGAIAVNAEAAALDAAASAQGAAAEDAGKAGSAKVDEADSAKTDKAASEGADEAASTKPSDSPAADAADTSDAHPTPDADAADASDTGSNATSTSADSAGEAAEDAASGSGGNAEDVVEDRVADGAYVIASELGTVIDIDGASGDNMANAQVYADNGSAAQRFHIYADGQDSNGEWYYRIENVNSGKVLDCVAGGCEPGTDVWQYESNGSAAQQWYLRKTNRADGTSYYQIVSRASGLALDVAGASSANGANVQVYTANGTAAQNWLLRRCDAVIADGAYTIGSGLGNNLVVDLDGGVGDNGASVQIYEGNDTLAQAFAFNYDEYSGYYRITSYASGKCLDVEGAARYAGAKVQQYTPNGTLAQRWSLISNEDGSYSITSAICGFALDVTGASAQNGTRLQQWGLNGTQAQRFYLRKTTPQFTGDVVSIANGDANYLVVDVQGASRDEGACIQGYDSNNTISQKFKLTRNDDGTYSIAALVSGLLVTGLDNGSVVQAASGASGTQRWVVSPTDDGHFKFSSLDGTRLLGLAGTWSGNGLSMVNAAGANRSASWNAFIIPLITNGLYTIGSAENEHFVLDVNAGSLSDCANVQLWDDNGSNAQKFIVTHLGDNVYSIVNIWSLKSIDVVSGTGRDGQDVWQYSYNGSNAQRWRAVWNGNGGFSFVSLTGNFALASDGAFAGSNVHLANANSADARQSYRLSFTNFASIGFDQRIAVLDVIEGSGLQTFRSMNGISQGALDRINSAIDNYHADGHDVSFVMIDLNTGAGVSYNIDSYYHSASTIKGPYITALNYYAPWALNYWGDLMYQTINVSSNEAYAAVRSEFGSWPIEDFVDRTHAWGFDTSRYYVSYTPRQLCKLWMGMADYFMSDAENAWWCRDVFSGNIAITSRSTLDWKGCTVYAKSGWTDEPRAHNEGCLVMDGDHPYVMVIMSSEYWWEPWKMSELMTALDAAHSELV